jgi:gluconolactonase
MRDRVKAEFEVPDERFRRCGGGRRLGRLHTGCRWTGGPACFPAGRFLVFSAPVTGPGRNCRRKCPGTGAG